MIFAALSLIILHWKELKHPSTGIYTRTSRLLPLGHKVDAISPASHPYSRQKDVGSKGLFPNDALLFYIGRLCVYLIDQI